MAEPRLTLGLRNLRSQINTAFPARDITSDGSIGDTLHKLHSSGHNPDDTAGSKPAWDGDPDTTPEIRAWDQDSDLNHPGVTAQQLVDHMRGLPKLYTVIRYMIFNRKIYHGPSFTPSDYTGASPHTEHIHYEGQWTQISDNNTTFNYHLEELVMPTPEDYANAVWDHPLENAYSGKDQPAGTILRYIPSRNEQDLIYQEVKDTQDKITAIETKLDAIMEKLNPTT